MSDFVTFFGLVYGEPSRRAFPVKIERGESVGVLKKLVKEEKKPMLDHLPADTLDLWKVNIPVADDEATQNPDLSNAIMLRSVDEIAEHFDGPPQTKTHTYRNKASSSGW